MEILKEFTHMLFRFLCYNFFCETQNEMIRCGHIYVCLAIFTGEIQSFQ